MWLLVAMLCCCTVVVVGWWWVLLADTRHMAECRCSKCTTPTDDAPTDEEQR